MRWPWALYARSGGAEVWLVDVADRMIQVMTGPETMAYAVARLAYPTGTLVVLDVELRVSDLLG